MLEKHLGPLKTGDVRELPYLMTDSALEKAFESGEISKLEVLEDGSIKIWNSKVEESQPDHFTYPTNSPHILMLDRNLGHLIPGVYDVPAVEH